MDSGIEFQKKFIYMLLCSECLYPPQNPYVETLTPNGDDTKEAEALRGS